MVYFNDPRNPSDPYPCIQSQTYEIRTSFLYSPITNQDILFIINEATQIQEVNFIDQSCRELGIIHNYYDISMHGQLSLFSPLSHLQTSLAQDLKGKTIVIINNQFTVSAQAGEAIQVHGIEYLSKHEVIQSIIDFQLHFVVLGKH